MSDNPFIPRAITVDGRSAAVIGEWEDRDEGRTVYGYDYRFDGELATHWIRHNSPRIGSRQP